MYKCNWAVVVPMANEKAEFYEFVSELINVLDKLQAGTV
jgi:hypothetical protein